jgi:hypothetical protein
MPMCLSYCKIASYNNFAVLLSALLKTQWFHPILGIQFPGKIHNKYAIIIIC